MVGQAKKAVAEKKMAEKALAENRFAEKAVSEMKAAEEKAAEEEAQVRSHTGCIESPSHCEGHVLMQVAPTFLFTHGCAEQDPRDAIDRSRARGRGATVGGITDR